MIAEWPIIVTLLMVHCAGLVSPGPDFLLVVQHSAREGRSAGVVIALGLATGLAAHTAFAIIGVSLVIHQYPILYITVQLLGGGYLAYLGLLGAKSVTQYFRSPQPINTFSTDRPLTHHLSFRQAFSRGLFTNLLNPKVIVFFLSLISSLIPAHMSIQGKSISIALLFLASFTWFATLALLFSSAKVQKKYLSLGRYLDGICSLIFISVGLSIIGHAFYSLNQAIY